MPFLGRSSRHNDEHNAAVEQRRAAEAAREAKAAAKAARDREAAARAERDRIEADRRARALRVESTRLR